MPWLVVLVSIVLALPARAQCIPAADTLALRAVGGPYVRARAVAVDARERLWVLDAGAATLLRSAGAGLPEAVVGGGGGADRFVAASGMAIEGGHLVFVADAGGGVVHRIGADGQRLAPLSVGARTEGRRGGDARGETSQVGEDVMPGRPLAVARAGKRTVVVEGRRRRVQVLDGQGRVEALLGGPGDRIPLVDPIAVVGDDAGWHVLDAGAQALVRYDPLGTPVRAALVPPGAAGLSWLDGAPVVLYADRLWLPGARRSVALAGRPSPGAGVRPGIVGLACAGGRLLVLDERVLYVATLRASAP